MSANFEANEFIHLCQQYPQIKTLLEQHYDQKVITIDEAMKTLGINTRKTVTNLFNKMKATHAGKYISGRGGPKPTRFIFIISQLDIESILMILNSSANIEFEQLLRKEPTLDGLKKALQAIEKVYGYKSPFK